MRHFVVTDEGVDVSERWLVWKTCAADLSPSGCPMDLYCDCVRTEDGALCEVVSRHVDEAVARRACELRQIDMEHFDLPVMVEQAAREAERERQYRDRQRERALKRREEDIDRREAAVARRELQLGLGGPGSDQKP